MSYLGAARSVDREKAENELSLNIKKAVDANETAPKQKHVRSCIVYTWDYKSSQSVWVGLRSLPLASDEVQCFKALITFHKVLRGGHPVTLTEGIREQNFLNTCARSVSGEGMRGYGSLIRGYVNFLLLKLDFHRQHPEFSGNMDYNDYLSMKGTNDPNEGYETIHELMNLQDKIEDFQKLIFQHFRPSSNNECRIAALVPLVEESHGIYNFLTSMLIAMHKRVDAMDALQPLRHRYCLQHHALRKFYYECSNLKYLTSLITVPNLAQEPPQLYSSTPPTRSRNPTPPPPEPEVDLWNEQQAHLQEQKKLQEQQRMWEMQQQQQQQLQSAERMRQQQEFEEQQRLQRERERMQMEALQQRQVEGKLFELERELLNYRNQHERDQMTIQQYDRRVRALEEEMNQIQRNTQQRDTSRDEMIRNLQEQIEMWKQKYEALAKLYAQLRQEHLELLGKYKSSSQRANAALDAISKMEKAQAEAKAKSIELEDAILERDRARNDLDRAKNSNQDELARLKREVAEANAKSQELGNARYEMETAVRKFEKEREEMLSAARDKQSRLDDLRRQLDSNSGELERLRMAKEEEIAILQAGMDQSLQALAAMSLNTTSNENTFQDALDKLTADMSAKTTRILDGTFTFCIRKIDDAIYDLESPANQGNTTATPEYTLNMVENVNTAGNQFTAALTKYLTDNSDETDIIACANALSDSLSKLLNNTKGVSRLVDDDDKLEELLDASKNSAEQAILFYKQARSDRLNSIPLQERSGALMQTNRELQASLGVVTKLTEALIPKSQSLTAEGDIGDAVEREMHNAAKVIENAAARLAELMNKPKDPTLNATDMQVHGAILESAMAMTNAIGNLIKCATATQQEIVTHGRGSSTKAAFYKKNNRWTEGLISAAKSVAVATHTLVEAADGVIHGTHSMEQLVVAANEVGFATAQLVAASRVKAVPLSKTQDRLESAAKAVTQASAALVKVVRQIMTRQAEEKAQQIDFSKLARHEFKVKEMEQQVQILTLEKELAQARRVLGEMRKVGYHAEEAEGGTV